MSKQLSMETKQQLLNQDDLFLPIKGIVGKAQISCNLSETPELPSHKTLDWVYEYDLAGEQHQYKVKEVLAYGETDYQHYAILDTYAYGKVLFLDGFVQSAQKDEHIYHECLIQPAMLSHPHPQKVLVIGAGEGASAREILYHPTVEKVVLIDLDQHLIEQVKTHLDTFHRGAFDHPKVELRFQDGYEYLQSCEEKFDVIVIDVVDAIEEGPAQKLYSREFYNYLRQHCLNNNGIVVVQSMEMNDVDLSDDWYVHREMVQSFKHVSSYATFVPSFWSKWRYTIASDDINVAALPSTLIQDRIQERRIEDNLLFFSAETFNAIMALSKQAKQRLQQVLAAPDHCSQEADISRHFIDWDPVSYLHHSRQKNL